MVEDRMLKIENRMGRRFIFPLLAKEGLGEV
jgi:hypothetical protein